MPADKASTQWQPGDDPLANLPEPAGTTVAQWRAKGLSDAKIRSLLLSVASWDGADGQLARLAGRPAPPPGPWQQAWFELHRRDAVNREHKATEARRVSDALDAELTESNTVASPSETPLEPVDKPSRGGRPPKPPPLSSSKARDAALSAYRAAPGVPLGADAQHEDYNGRYREQHPAQPKLPRTMFRPSKIVTK